MDNFVIGIDGGGTGMSVMAADREGKVLESLTGGAMNYNGGNKALIDSNLLDIFHQLADKDYPPERCAAVCIGAAGVSNPNVEGQLREMIRRAGFSCPAIIVGDAEIAFAGALDDRAGIVLISGTGSICMAKDQEGRVSRTGGFGHLIDDGGSGYVIARDILTAVVKASDGRTEPTALRELVFDYLKLSTMEELISYVYLPDRNKREIAQLSVLIDKAAELEDWAAAEIIEKCISELVELVTPMLPKFRTAPKLAVAGSVLLNNTRIREGFRNRIHALDPGICVTTPRHPAVYGAVLLALRQLEEERE